MQTHGNQPSNTHSERDRPAAPHPSWHEIAGYVALASGLCWLVIAPAMLGFIDAELAPALVPVAQLTPLLAALVFVRVLRPGRARNLLALRWNRSGRWAAMGVGILVLIGAVQLVSGLLLGWRPRPTAEILTAASVVLPLLVLQATFAVGEETGWRGWLLSRTRHLGFPAAAAISAGAWTLWHLPALTFLPDPVSAESAAYLLGIASWAPFLVALRLVSGSVWPPVLVHGAINSVRVFQLQSVADSGGVDWRVEALGWVLWLLAAVLLARHGGRQTKRLPEHGFAVRGLDADTTR